MDEEQIGGATWVVDFENMTKAFFSSQLLQHFEWMEESVTDNATNVIRNFLNYLHYHNVCPEYIDDLNNARSVCDLAQKELPKLANAARGLPGDFNTACSTLFGGYYAMRRPANPNAEWVNKDDDLGWSDEEAKAIWITALVAHCTPEQYKQFEQADEAGSLTTVEEHDTGLEVVEIQLPNEQAQGLYSSEGIQESTIRPTGKLICKRWVAPGSPQLDIPEEAIAAREAKLNNRRYEFIVEEDVLRSCYPGMKLEATVIKFSVGDISYLDSVQFVYPSFFTWTLNERLRDFTASGPPKEWMKRQNDKHKLDAGTETAETEAMETEVAEPEVAKTEHGLPAIS